MRFSHSVGRFALPMRRLTLFKGPARTSANEDVLYYFHDCYDVHSAHEAA